jgi:hypothetical protein
MVTSMMTITISLAMIAMSGAYVMVFESHGSMMKFLRKRDDIENRTFGPA